jgi:hypothetical protein
MNNINKQLYIIAIGILLSISAVSAVDNSYYEPTCINPSYDTGYNLQLTSNNATNGNMFAVELNPLGSIITANNRVSHGVNILCTLSDRITSHVGFTRIFGTSEDGSVWYSDANVINYSAGFYALGPLDLSCGGFGGNCNPLYKIDTLTASTYGRKLAEDSAGNIYTSVGSNIYIYSKSSGYGQALFYTLTAGTDYTAATGSGVGGTFKVEVIGMKFDQSGNLHILIGTEYVGNAQVTAVAYVSRTVVSPAGTRIKSDLGISSASSAYGYYTSAGTVYGGLVLDVTNPMSNYTYGYIGDSCQSGSLCPLDYVGNVYLKHNSSTGTTTIATVTLTTIGDIGYFANKIFVSSWGGNVIRSYSTGFVGYTPSSGFVGVIALTYTTKDISSLHATYYNDSSVQIAYNVVVPTNPIAALDSVVSRGIYGPAVQPNYKWIVGITDPNQVEYLTEFTPLCTYDSDIFPYACSVSGTMTFIPASTGWTNGSWTPKLYEYTISTGARALITTGTNYTVLNQTSGGGSVSQGCGNNCGNTPIDIHTALLLLNVFGMIAFWGFVIWLGIVGSVIIAMAKGSGGVNGTAVVIVAWLSAVFIALVGLFDPFKIYIIVLTTIIAAVMFKYGRSATVEE